jgi:uncharacterized protein (TIGR02271 family)
MLGALSRLPSWELDRTEEDVRGWPMKDKTGSLLGTVDELIVDTDTQYIAQVVLSDGRRFPAHDVFIGDGVVTLGALPRPSQAVATNPPAANPPAPRAQTQAQPPPPAAPRAQTQAQPAPPPAPRAQAQAPAPLPPVSARALEARPVEAAPRAVRTAEIVPTRPLAVEGDLVIPLIDEELDVGTRVVEAGGVRVSSHMTERPVEKTVRLRDERVTVERQPIDRPLTPEEAEARFRDGSVEMRAMSEIPVVGKRAHVIEEIFITKDITERTETVRDTVRHTEANVEELPSKHTPGRTSEAARDEGRQIARERAPERPQMPRK